MKKVGQRLLVVLGFLLAACVPHTPPAVTSLVPAAGGRVLFVEIDGLSRSHLARYLAAPEAREPDRALASIAGNDGRASKALTIVDVYPMLPVEATMESATLPSGQRPRLFAERRLNPARITTQTLHAALRRSGMTSANAGFPAGGSTFDARGNSDEERVADLNRWLARQEVAPALVTLRFDALPSVPDASGREPLTQIDRLLAQVLYGEGHYATSSLIFVLTASYAETRPAGQPLKLLELAHAEAHVTPSVAVLSGQSDESMLALARIAGIDAVIRRTPAGLELADHDIERVRPVQKFEFTNADLRQRLTALLSPGQVAVLPQRAGCRSPDSSLCYFLAAGGQNTPDQIADDREPVPLLIAGEELNGRSLDLKKVTVQDVAPTIAAMLGVPPRVLAGSGGRSLTPDLWIGRNRPARSPEAHACVEASDREKTLELCARLLEKTTDRSDAAAAIAALAKVQEADGTLLGTDADAMNRIVNWLDVDVASASRSGKTDSSRGCADNADVLIFPGRMSTGVARSLGAADDASAKTLTVTVSDCRLPTSFHSPVALDLVIGRFAPALVLVSEDPRTNAVSIETRTPFLAQWRGPMWLRDVLSSTELRAGQSPTIDSAVAALVSEIRGRWHSGQAFASAERGHWEAAHEHFLRARWRGETSALWHAVFHQYAVGELDAKNVQVSTRYGSLLQQARQSRDPAQRWISAVWDTMSYVEPKQRVSDAGFTDDQRALYAAVLKYQRAMGGGVVCRRPDPLGTAAELEEAAGQLLRLDNPGLAARTLKAALGFSPKDDLKLSLEQLLADPRARWTALDTASRALLDHVASPGLKVRYLHFLRELVAEDVARGDRPRALNRIADEISYQSDVFDRAELSATVDAAAPRGSEQRVDLLLKIVPDVKIAIAMALLRWVTAQRSLLDVTADGVPPRHAALARGYALLGRSFDARDDDALKSLMLAHETLQEGIAESRNQRRLDSLYRKLLEADMSVSARRAYVLASMHKSAEARVEVDHTVDAAELIMRDLLPGAAYDSAAQFAPALRRALYALADYKSTGDAGPALADLRTEVGRLDVRVGAGDAIGNWLEVVNVLVADLSLLLDAHDGLAVSQANLDRARSKASDLLGRWKPSSAEGRWGLVLLFALQDALQDVGEIIGPRAPKEVTVPPMGRGFLSALTRFVQEVPKSYPDASLHESHRVGFKPHLLFIDLLGAALQAQPGQGKPSVSELLAAELFREIASISGSKAKVTSKGREPKAWDLLDQIIGAHAESVVNDTLTASPPRVATFTSYLLAVGSAARDRWKEVQNWVDLARRHTEGAPDTQSLLLDVMEYRSSQRLSDPSRAEKALSRVQQECPGLAPELGLARAAIAPDREAAYREIDLAMRAAVARGSDSPLAQLAVTYQAGEFELSLRLSNRNFGLRDRKGGDFGIHPTFRTTPREVYAIDWSFVDETETSVAPLVGDALALKAWVAMANDDDRTAGQALSDILGLYHNLDLAVFGQAGHIAPAAHQNVLNVFHDPRIPLWLATVAELRGHRAIAARLFAHALRREAWDDAGHPALQDARDVKCSVNYKFPEESHPALKHTRCEVPSLFSSYIDAPDLHELVYLRTARAILQTPEFSFPRAVADHLKSYDRVLAAAPAVAPRLVPAWAPALDLALRPGSRLSIPLGDAHAIDYARTHVHPKFVCDMAYAVAPNSLNLAYNIANSCDRWDAAREILEASLDLATPEEAGALVGNVIAAESYFADPTSGQKGFWDRALRLSNRLVIVLGERAPETVPEHARKIATLPWTPDLALRFRAIALAFEIKLGRLPRERAVDLLQQALNLDAGRDTDPERRFLKTLVFVAQDAPTRVAEARRYLAERGLESNGTPQRN